MWRLASWAKRRTSMALDSPLRSTILASVWCCCVHGLEAVGQLADRLAQQGTGALDFLLAAADLATDELAQLAKQLLLLTQQARLIGRQREGVAREPPAERAPGQEHRRHQRQLESQRPFDELRDHVRDAEQQRGSDSDQDAGLHCGVPLDSCFYRPLSGRA
jgi:hypothetical protein